MRAPPASSEAVRRSMQANRRVNTSPEVALRSEMHRRGFRFRKAFPVQVGPLRVRVDIVFLRKRFAVFVDGCFWHCCPEHGASPKANVEYWRAKLQGNAERDRLVSAALREA